MKCMTRTRAWPALSLSVLLFCAPTAWGVNYVVDGLDGNDANTGVSATGGENDLPGLDFSDAFKTIGKATSLTTPGDFIFVNAGEYSEAVSPTSGTTLIAVGEAVIANGGIGFQIALSNVTVDGFTIKNSIRGVQVNGNPGDFGIKLRNLNISSCGTGVFFGTGEGANVVRCVITDCAAGILMRSGQYTVEQCSIVGNGTGVFGLGGAGHVFRNNIVAFNTIDGIVGGSGGLVDFNDVFGNGVNYTGISPGPNDLSVDPQFIDLSRRILHLQPTSPLVNAGEKLGGGPRVTIGARDIGFASSDTLNAWADWRDSNGDTMALCSVSPADVCIEDASGHIILNTGVNRASVISVVFDGSLKSVEFATLEDLTPPSGMRRVIDADDSTFQRVLEFRGSNQALRFDPAAPDVAPLDFIRILEGQVLESSFRFVQVRMTLTTKGL